MHARFQAGRRAGQGFLLAAWCALQLSPAHLRAEIIDRIAVSVGDQVITETEIGREVRVSAFLDGKKPDLSPAARRAAADRMVEQKLIRRELETSRYPAPSPAEVEPLIEKFKREQFKDDADYRRALSEDGITEQDVKDRLLWERTFLLFIEVRFRPAVQVSEEMVQDYFERVVKPAHPGQAVTLDDYRSDIEDKLAEGLVDQEVEKWLKEARQRTEIVYHDEAFR